jgi:hypothetical protein
MPTRNQCWFGDTKEYDTVRATIGPDPQYPKTYDEWLQLATKRVANLESGGWTINKVVVEPKEFIRFCDSKGLDRGVAALGLFVASKGRGLL